MSSFTNQLYLKPTDNPSEWKLTRGFTYYLGSKDSGMKITVPRGFVTNFASVPRAFWSILPPFGRYGKAAVIHDYLYAKKTFSKKVADAVFYEAMGVLKVRKWKQRMMYNAVNIFGRKAWNKAGAEGVKEPKGE